MRWGVPSCPLGCVWGGWKCQLGQDNPTSHPWQVQVTIVSVKVLRADQPVPSKSPTVLPNPVVEQRPPPLGKPWDPPDTSTGPTPPGRASLCGLGPQLLQDRTEPSCTLVTSTPGLNSDPWRSRAKGPSYPGQTEGRTPDPLALRLCPQKSCPEAKPAD